MAGCYHGGWLEWHTRGWEGGQGLEITCWWGSLEPLCKHGWNENKVGCFFSSFGDLYGIQAQHYRLSCMLPFRKAPQCRRLGPQGDSVLALCTAATLSSVAFLQWGYKGWQKKNDRRIVIIEGGNTWYDSSELEWQYLFLIEIIGP